MVENGDRVCVDVEDVGGFLGKITEPFDGPAGPLGPAMVFIREFHEWVEDHNCTPILYSLSAALSFLEAEKLDHPGYSRVVPLCYPLEFDDPSTAIAFKLRWV